MGPPGVGKTYAVKAVQSFCAHTCKVNIGSSSTHSPNCFRIIQMHINMQVRIFEISIASLLSEADPVQVLDAQFAAIAALRRTPVSVCGDVNYGEMQSPGTPSKSHYLRSAASTPGSATSSASAASTPFATPSSSSVASAQRNNTFAYRSPAAMAASAAASAAATPSTNKKGNLLNSHNNLATPGPSTPVGKTPQATATAKMGLLGGRTPPPTSFKDMLAASRAGKKISAEVASATPAVADVPEAAQDSVNKEQEQVHVQYLAEMAFVVIDEVSIFVFPSLSLFLPK